MSLEKIISNQPSLRDIYTSQRFTRLNIFPTERKTKTSQAPRAFPHQIRNKSLQNNKENIGFASYMKKVESSSKIDEKAEISKYLWSLRKEYDKLVKLTNQKKFKIHQMQKQIQQMRTISEGQRQKFDSTNNLVESKVDSLNQFFHKQEQIKMDRKILMNIIDRMKNDSLWRKCETRNKQLQMKEKQKSLRSAEEASIQWDQSIHKMTQKLTQFEQELQNHNSYRREKLGEYENRLQELQEKQNFQLERRSRTYQLLSMESNDILDAKNVMLRDILFAHKMLNSVLQSKIQDLLKANQHSEESYHKIKTQTNIEDPKQLCSKFMSYSEVLREITSKINLYEKMLEEAIERNKQLGRIQSERRTKRLEEEKSRTIREDNILSEKEKLRIQATEKELEVKKIKDWVNKNISILNIEYKNQNLSETVNLLCSNLISEVKQAQDLRLEKVKYQAPSFRMKKVLKELSMQDEKQKRSEAYEVSQSNAYEAVYLQKQRKQLKKNRFLIKSQLLKSKKE